MVSDGVRQVRTSNFALSSCAISDARARNLVVVISTGVTVALAWALELVFDRHPLKRQQAAARLDSRPFYAGFIFLRLRDANTCRTQGQDDPRLDLPTCI